jgi:hypothetical protein
VVILGTCVGVGWLVEPLPRAKLVSVVILGHTAQQIDVQSARQLANIGKTPEDLSRG